MKTARLHCGLKNEHRKDPPNVFFMLGNEWKGEKNKAKPNKKSPKPKSPLPTYACRGNAEIQSMGLAITDYPKQFITLI